MTDGDVQSGSKTIAIMQPYLFPYIGYFQLAHSVDEFWLLDNVNFIRRGWMNRNNLLVNGNRWLYTIPVNSGPRDQLILHKTFSPDAVHTIDKLYGTLHTSYSKAPHLDRVLELVAAVRDAIVASSKPADFTETTEFALRKAFDMIGIATPIYRVSSLNLANGLSGQGRILAACEAVGANRYVNMIGGKDLYSAECFATAGVELFFLDPSVQPYDQGVNEAFVPGLSILDVIAWVDPGTISLLYEEYGLIEG